MTTRRCIRGVCGTIVGMAQHPHSSVDEYIEQFDGVARERLVLLRQLIVELQPDAEEVISYNMPAYKLPGRSVHQGVFFAGYNDFVSLYPLPSAQTYPKLMEQLAPYIHGKGTARFAHSQPLPLALIKSYIKARFEQAA